MLLGEPSKRKEQLERVHQKDTGLACPVLLSPLSMWPKGRDYGLCYYGHHLREGFLAPEVAALSISPLEPHRVCIFTSSLSAPSITMFFQMQQSSLIHVRGSEFRDLETNILNVLHLCLLKLFFSHSVLSTLCDPMECSMPGLPVLHHLPELAQFVSIESVMPSNHLILCHPLLLLPSILPSIRVFSNESALHIKWPKYCCFSIGSSNEYSGLISFRIDWFDLLAVRDSRVFSNTTVQKYYNKL